MSQPTRERVLTWPLLAFLLVVAAAVGLGFATGARAATVDEAIELLADGDLDGDERDRMLLRTIDLAREAESRRGRWAGLLAAAAAEDEGAYAHFDARIGDGADAAPDAAERRWLDLGDPLLANLLKARIAALRGDDAGAEVAWRQVAAQARMTANGFAAQLAAAALGG